MSSVKIIECPRDAMQGLHDFIPTEVKVEYIQGLLKANFDTLDFGSFVSPKAIPQMKDTAEVLGKLDLSDTKTKLLAIVANTRGAHDAMQFSQIKYIGFPFSVSETFQMRNTNSSMQQSIATVNEMLNLCDQNNKKLVVYLSMGFGNPYGDEWNVEIVEQWADKMHAFGVDIISLSDTIGVATPDSISYLFKKLIPAFPRIEFGAHLHTTPHTWFEKVDAAYNSGCKRFDGAIKGFGGCPMATDKLTGNMPTENLLNYFENKSIDTGVDKHQFALNMQQAAKVFGIA
jgi:hydroxymethylglutaryl-CoA lyase